MDLIECVPNVSEGRRLDVVSMLSHAMSVAGPVTLLDASADADHNRAVFTTVGPAPALQRAVLGLVEAAIAQIDLRHHRGVHPRVGSVDVVPFVPIGNTRMDACIELAHRTAREVASRFDIPVFLYEAAASRPDRRRLEVLRRGQLDGLAARMLDPAWTPDYGPARLHPTAGACVIGARGYLVAYNINLATTDLTVAQRIARRVRERDGGLPGVKAMGVALARRQLVQVSMNLTNIDMTPIAPVFEAVRTAASNEGVNIVEAELVGLAPEAAFRGCDPPAVGLASVTDSQILERRLERLRQ